MEVPDFTRDVIATAIVKAFEDDYQKHGTNYDPDTCHRAADEVLAVLFSQLWGRPVKAVFDPVWIKPATFEFVEE